LDDSYWRNAFHEDAPDLSYYLTSFRAGVLNGRVDLLNWFDDAKYFVKEEFLPPIVWRLIQIAAEHPQSDFVETLSYFLRKSRCSKLLTGQVKKYSEEELGQITADIEKLVAELVKSGDDDLAQNYLAFLGEIGASRE
jgi:hypothetical protein